jgi:hypothetical protein
MHPAEHVCCGNANTGRTTTRAGIAVATTAVDGVKRRLDK